LLPKTIPVFKNKGQTKDIENYRPITNLCSLQKAFEKLILKESWRYKMKMVLTLLVENRLASTESV
jgi:hypothetical protein